MYIPTGSITLDKITDKPQIRLGIQGYGGTGKTYSALTFENIVVWNRDRGLGAHTGRADVIEVPAWNPSFLKSINPNYKTVEDVKDTTQMWLEREATKLEPNQTLVFDGGTALQKDYESWIAKNEPVTRSGEVDSFAKWRLKIEFFGDIMSIFKTLRCHVIYLCHESEKPDKTGNYTGKLRPLLTGGFSDQLISHFTDWFRQHASDKLEADKIDDKVLKLWGMNRNEFISMQNTYPRGTMYFWQTEGDAIFDGKCSSLVNFPRFIPSNFLSFQRYMRGVATKT